MYAKGDRIENHTLGIVRNVKNHITSNTYSKDPDMLYVTFGETYGGTVSKESRQYTSNKSYGYRLFDIMTISFVEAQEILQGTLAQIAGWRDRGGQHFLNVDQLTQFATQNDIELVPYIEVTEGAKIPTTLGETYDWLQKYANTNVRLDAHGKAEGVVVRNFDRSLIRKIRFEDYEKTKRKNLF